MTEAKIFSCSQSYNLATSIAEGFGAKLGEIKFSNFSEILPLVKINRRSVVEVNKWIEMWNNSKLTKIKFSEMEIET